MHLLLTRGSSCSRAPSLAVAGLTPLHCAAISHGATVKALSSAGLADASLNATADDKLSCLQMLLSAGAIITSQVERPPLSTTGAFRSEEHTSELQSR